MTYWLGYIIVLVVGITLGGGTISLVRRYKQKSLLGVKLVENMALSFLALFLTFMAAEVFFKFFAQSDGWNHTLASKNWFSRYWQLNSMGYRDVEWSSEDLRQKHKILVIGDSFAAGQGIANVEDRFSNLLGIKLGPDYLVMNISTPALSTKDEIDRVRNFPYKPEILILAYFINDIRYAAEQRGVFGPKLDIEPWPIFKPLVDNSYAINFIYWRVIRLGPNLSEMNNMDWLRRAYNDPDAWWVHQQELLTIYNGATSERVKLIVVVFPDLVDVQGSQVMTSKVINLFRERGIPTLDVTELVEDVPTKQLIVNLVDPHPSKWVHQQVADKLYEMVKMLE